MRESIVKIIDQTKLPHNFIIKELKTVKDAINAIKVMEVRGDLMEQQLMESFWLLVMILNLLKKVQRFNSI